MAKKEISRREFLKGSAAAGLGLAATLGMGGALAFADGATYKPGKYQANLQTRQISGNGIRQPELCHRGMHLQ